MMQMVNRSAHNGVASYWLDREGLCTGTLVFGVGLRDEPETQAGITHLIEHVLLRMVQPVTVPHGGMVKEDSVEFYASGDAEAVAGFLNAVAAAVSKFSAVTEDALALEKSVIEAEDPQKFTSVSAGLLTYRFGTSGLGAAHFGAPATKGLTRAEAIEWAGRWLTTGNAALTFTGPLPGTLDIRLPPGKVPVRNQCQPVITTPTLIKSKKRGVALSLLVPSRSAGLLGEALRYELLSRLRHSEGLIYSVVNFTTNIDTDESQLDLILDPTGPSTVPALRASVTAVRRIAVSGFSEDAVQSARHVLITELGWDEKIPSDYLDQVAVDALLGRPSPDRQEMLGRAMALTSAELTAVLKASLGSLIVALHKTVKLRKADAADLELAIEPYEIWQRHNGAKDPHPTEEADDGNPTWPNKSSKATLRFTPTHLMKSESGKTKSILLADVVVVGDRSCGCISLMDRRGRSTELDVDEWKGSKKLRSSLLKAFPAEIIRSFPED